MDIAEESMIDLALSSPTALCAVTVAGVAAGSFLPVSGSEPLLLAVASVAPPSLRVPLVALATVGAMSTKTIVYLCGRGVCRAMPSKHRARLERVRERLGGRRWRRLSFLAFSSATGLPPFYLVTALSGSARVPLIDFVLAGASGHALRFALLIFLPQLLGFIR
jgi:membrane protein YqaA with SNARE-associated domain